MYACVCVRVCWSRKYNLNYYDCTELALIPYSRRCTATVSGLHEPSLTMKDNDLKYKIRLPRPDATRLLRQLENDADFLLSIGVMDYSLLGWWL